MARKDLPDLTGNELLFEEDEVLTSKTNLQGKISYANDPFCRVAGFEYSELDGAPHSVIRHPEMPRAIFHLMWNTIEAGNEFFGYVMNRCKNGDHYWVLAHVVPDLDPKTREILGYHSTRRCPSRPGVEMAEQMYAQLRADERSVPRTKQVEVGTASLHQMLADEGMNYEEWIFSKINQWEVA